MAKSTLRWRRPLKKAVVILFLSTWLPYIFLLYFAFHQPSKVENWAMQVEKEFGTLGARLLFHYFLLPLYITSVFTVFAPALVFVRPFKSPLWNEPYSWLLLASSLITIGLITVSLALMVFQELFGNLRNTYPQTTSSDEEVERRAYRLWRSRGCPPGSPEIDWFQAKKEIEEAKGLTRLIQQLLGSYISSSVFALTRTGLRLMFGLALTYGCTIYLFASIYGLIARLDSYEFSGVGSWSLFDALYFSLTTATTIGDAEVHAKLPLAKAVVMLQLIIFLSYTVLFFSLAAGAIRRKFSADNSS